MFNKLIFYILLLLINSSLEYYYASKLSQYGSVTVNETSVLYLSLNSFKSNDTLYFVTSFNNGYYYSSNTLGFWEYNKYYYSDYSSFNYNKSYSYSRKGTNHTFYFSYTLKQNKTYLLIRTPYFTDCTNTVFTIKHVKELPNNKEEKYNYNKEGNIVGGIICIVIDVILFIALNIILCRCKRKNEESLRQLVESTNTNQTKYSNQPVFTQPQPLYEQSPTPVN